MNGETMKNEKSAQEVQSIISKGMQYPMKKILERYCSEKSVSMKVAREQERELKRFLILFAINKQKLGMRSDLDELWHTFILFTREYTDFCNEIAGFYIHHNPKTEEDSSSNDTHESFITNYKSLYGEEPPKKFWSHDAWCETCKVDCSIPA
jgi:hypothetical protein